MQTEPRSKLPPILTGRSIRLRMVQPDDAQLVIDLRTDPERNQYISPTLPDIEQQRRWLTAYKEREREGAEFYFVIESAEHAPLGLVRMYDFRPGSFRWGSWIVRPGAPAATALESALMIYETAFWPLGFDVSLFEVRRGNDRVIAFHQRMGAEIVDSSKIEFFFQYTKAQYIAARPRFAKYLPAAGDQA